MIVSHEHKFIFVKSKKTAGSSIELALSEYCGPRDIVSSLEMDEPARLELGYRGKQNDAVPFRGYTWRMAASAIKRHERLHFYNHYRAADIRRAVGPRIWNSYFTFSVERNPYDRSISRYWFDNPNGGADMLDYFRNLGDDLSNWQRYAIGDRVAVDRVLRYETLAADLANVGAEIGIVLQLPGKRLKGELRGDRRPYAQVLGRPERELIERVCAKEIAAFGYTWG